MLRVIAVLFVAVAVLTACGGSATSSNQVRDLRATVAALESKLAHSPEPVVLPPVTVTVIVTVTPPPTRPPTVVPAATIAPVRTPIPPTASPSPTATPAPTPVPTFIAASNPKHEPTACPDGFPVKLDYSGYLRLPTDRDYAKTSTWRCYDTYEHAKADATSEFKDARSIPATGQYGLTGTDLPAELGQYNQNDRQLIYLFGASLFGISGLNINRFSTVEPTNRGIDSFGVEVFRNADIAAAKKQFPSPGSDGTIDISGRQASLEDNYIIWDGPTTTRLTYSGPIGPDDEVQAFRTTTTEQLPSQKVVYFSAYYRYYLRHGTTTALVGFVVERGRAEQRGAGAAVDDTPFRLQADSVVAIQMALLQNAHD